MLLTVENDKLVESKIKGERKQILELLKEAKKNKELIKWYTSYDNERDREYVNKEYQICYDKVKYKEVICGNWDNRKCNWDNRKRRTAQCHDVYAYNKSQSINFLYNTEIDFRYDFNYSYYYEYDEDIVLLRMLKNDLEEIKKVKQLISELSVLNPDTAKKIMETLYEDFYFFATKVMDNVKIKPESSHDLNELLTLKKLAKKNNVDLDSKTSELINSIGVAKDNTKVLSLAKEVRKIK